MSKEIATFALGCFWQPQFFFSKIDGVIETFVGFMGGTTNEPTYEEVCYNDTDHIETVKIIFDNDIISFETLLNMFFENHNPTQIDGQNVNIGRQYISAIFYQNDTQKEISTKKINFLQEKMDEKIVTELIKADRFFLAEEYHQHYISKNK